MSQLAALLSALVPLLGLAGGAVAWILKRMDARIATAETKVDDCEKHRVSDQELMAKLIFEVRRDHIAIRILFKALQRVDPRNSALGNVSDLLRQSYDPQAAVPDDFSALLGQLGSMQ